MIGNDYVEDMYRVTFNLEGKTHAIRAKTVETEYPMILVRDLIWSSGSALIVAPEDETHQRFKDTSELILPFHSIQLIEEISERRPELREINPRKTTASTTPLRTSTPEKDETEESEDSNGDEGTHILKIREDLTLQRPRTES